MSIYQPNFLTPQNISVDAKSPIIFSATIQGDVCTNYQLRIYKLDNTLIYDSTKIELAIPLYQNDIFNFTVSANQLQNGIQYKWTLEAFQNSISAISRETPFYCYEIPIVSMVIPSIINSKTYEFQATYTQTQYMSIKRWYMVFKDSSNNILLQTPYSYSSNIRYIFDGFANGAVINVQTIVESQVGVITSSSIYTFSISYSQPSMNITPTVTLLSELSAVEINWNKPIQITGSVVGVNEYVPNLLIPDNKGLHLDIGSYPSWESTTLLDESTTYDETSTYDEYGDATILLNQFFGTNFTSSYVDFIVDIPELFTFTIDYIPDETFHSGIIVEFFDVENLNYEIGYDGEKFYFISNGKLINGDIKVLPNTNFLIGIKGIEVLIIVNNQIYEYLHM